MGVVSPLMDTVCTSCDKQVNTYKNFRIMRCVASRVPPSTRAQMRSIVVRQVWAPALSKIAPKAVIDFKTLHFGLEGRR